MSESIHAKPTRRRLKKFMALAFLVYLFGVLSLGSAVCQTPGYGAKPDQWAPYATGRYFDHLRKIASAYRISDSKIAYLHFELSETGVGPVDLFRIPDRPNSSCDESDCYLFVLFASDYSGTPLVTPCKFKEAGLTHLFNPDGSRFYGFEFLCEGSVLQVKVTSNHFMANLIERRVETGK
jgi:hypothetical protein